MWHIYRIPPTSSRKYTVRLGANNSAIKYAACSEKRHPWFHDLITLKCIGRSCDYAINGFPVEPAILKYFWIKRTTPLPKWKIKALEIILYAVTKLHLDT